MLLMLILIGLAAIVASGWGTGQTPWRRRLLFYMWALVLALASAYVLPIVIGAVTQ